MIDTPQPDPAQINEDEGANVPSAPDEGYDQDAEKEQREEGPARSVDVP